MTGGVKTSFQVVWWKYMCCMTDGKESEKAWTIMYLPALTLHAYNTTKFTIYVLRQQATNGRCIETYGQKIHRNGEKKPLMIQPSTHKRKVVEHWGILQAAGVVI